MDAGLLQSVASEGDDGVRFAQERSRSTIWIATTDATYT
jgi:hypothetical protein